MIKVFKWIRSILFAFAILLLFYLGLNLEGRLHTLGSEQFIEFLAKMKRKLAARSLIIDQLKAY